MFPTGIFYSEFVVSGSRLMQKNKEASVRFFRADGVQVESVIELAGPHKAEYLKRIIRAVARNAAKRDHLAEPPRQPASLR